MRVDSGLDAIVLIRVFCSRQSPELPGPSWGKFGRPLLREFSGYVVDSGGTETGSEGPIDFGENGIPSPGHAVYLNPECPLGTPL
jgi:hypothetical protein